ncbi:MAG: discoidin domain-containing protein [Flavobacteriales bacterium]|nr:discoidin domain-containing protein [Flavobacteriales bacterium]
MRHVFPALACLLLALRSIAQCDTVNIAHDSWSVAYVDSEELTGEGPNNGHGVYCIDGDSLTFWHTEWQAQDPPFPHEIQLDLGAAHAVNGISLLSRSQTAAGKAKDYELYLGLDSINWGAAQSMGTFMYADPAGVSQRANVYFGAVDARYVRLVVHSNYGGTPHLMIAEFDVFEYAGPGCGATGQNNQVVTIDAIAVQTTTSAPIQLSGTASSGLPLTYEVVSGPATVNGDLLTLDGMGGTVTVRAVQDGNDDWYPASATTSFEVLDLSTYFPEVATKLTDAYPVQMPALHAYPLYASASIAEPDFNSITSVAFNADGEELPTSFEGGSWMAWWTPSGYGPHTVEVTAWANNGNSTTTNVQVEVTDLAEDRTERTFDSAVIDMGTIGSQWYTGSYTLPQSVGAFNKIMAHLIVTCPSVPGGCDDWDRLASIEVKAPDGRWVEIIRYVTPYGRACDHWLDVTDFASLLQGNIDVRMYIDTWGTGGWKLDLDFQYEAGQPDHLYSTVQEIWRGNYNFGDPANLQPVDTVELTPPWHAETAGLRLVTSGHGWGSNNTGNAAEFYHAVHHVYVDGQPFEQDLWTICNPNPDGCQPQAGTWQYARAGWCPGSIAAPFAYDLAPLFTGGPMQFVYRFQESYVDLCHPNNPDCINGVTCPNCNDGYNPFYPVSAYLISKGNAPMTVGITSPAPVNEYQLGISPNPTHGYFNLHLDGDMGPCVATLHDITGGTLKTWFLGSQEQLQAHPFRTDGLAAGTYFVRVQSETARTVGKVVVQ